MSDVVCARNLMLTNFRRIRADQCLGDAVTALREAQRQPGLPNALMVVGEGDQFLGMLTAKLLIRILVGQAGEPTEPTGSLELDEKALLAVARRRLSTLVGDALIPDVPVVAPTDRLLTMVRRGVSSRLDFVPVVDENRPVGLAPITAIFQAAALMALTPEHEGIRFDR